MRAIQELLGHASISTTQRYTDVDEAETLPDALADESDLDGAAVWRRILEAIDELQRGRREGESLN